MYNLINNCISDEQKIKLEELLTSKIDNKTKLAWLKETPRNYSPESFIKVIDRLECIRDLNSEIDLEKNMMHTHYTETKRKNIK